MNENSNGQSPDVMQLLRKDLCLVDLKAKTKEALLEEFSKHLQEHPALENVAAGTVLKALSAREELGSTGFGGGLAIPHCRLKGATEFVLALGVSHRGVPFDAVDGKKVQLFCVIVGPADQPQQHVKVLAQISLVLKQEHVRRELIKAPTQTALYESFARHAFHEASTGKPRKHKLLMLVLQDEETVTDVMELFVEAGVRGAAVLESRGMGKVLTNVPLFASFINFLGSGEEYHRTIYAVVPEDQVDRLLEGIEEITGDMDTHAGAMAIVLNIARMRGSLQAV